MRGLFYGSCTAKQRAGILKRFKLGEIRVLSATEAFGLGCDISFIKYVIRWGNAASFLSLELHWGRGGRGQEPLVEDSSMLVGKRCTCIWFTSKDTFGPLLNAHIHDKSGDHPFINEIPVDLKRAVSHRQRLVADSPALYHLANPEGWECVHVWRRKELRPVVGGSIRQLGGEWTVLQYVGARYHLGDAVEAVSWAIFHISTTIEIV
ncbi:MAG: hypothetical protein TREMPRED_005543 [Tremellales sp. Tagirdzhanova-0007]|nr:MAG: hypothetical protein TREMPRED_005543 [Tremellales sp. Tagirdzhanova-0007]